MSICEKYNKLSEKYNKLSEKINNQKQDVLFAMMNMMFIIWNDVRNVKYGYAVNVEHPIARSVENLR